MILQLRPFLRHVFGLVIVYASVYLTQLAEARGIELQSGNSVLNDLSKYFNEETVYDLAAILLADKCPGGGYGFIKRNRTASGVTNWRLMALAVLCEWCEQSQEKVFGGELLKVLERILPSVARVFDKKLVVSAAASK